MPISGLKEKFESMAEALVGVKSITVLCHDNPDPDALASMLGLRFLYTRHFKLKVRLVYGGEIGRAENQAMVRLLKIPVENIENVRIRKDAKFALVDTQPQFHNNSLPNGASVLIVFDHHPPPKKVSSSFYHVNKDLGATSTLVYNYIRHAGLDFDSRLATAFAYALISETQDLGREASRDDIIAYQELIARANLRILANIRSPLLPHNYFRTLYQALHNTCYYKNIVVTRLGNVESADMIHQMADLLLRFERRSWSLCIGRTDEYILLSLRSSNVRARCGKMIMRLVGDKGHAGGHDMVAGGRIKINRGDGADIPLIEELVITRLLKYMGHPGNLDIMMPLVGLDK
ncbi:bifunctional oligoribonuclease/PAP phosphatase NrnA [Gemmatimonadota bacterium]